jgi:vanadium chloroperoxidase
MLYGLLTDASGHSPASVRQISIMGDFICLPLGEEPQEYNSNYILYWNHVGLELNRLTHSLGAQSYSAPQSGPPASARALGILHLAIHDAYFAIKPPPVRSFTTYLTAASAPPLPTRSTGATDPRMAVAGAAITVLAALYTTADAAKISSEATRQLNNLLTLKQSGFPGLDKTTPSYMFGRDVGNAMLNLLKVIGPELSQDGYEPKSTRYYFNDEPTNPVRLVPVDINNINGDKKPVHVYHAPFYGEKAKRFAVQTEHVIADPPVGTSISNSDGTAEYNDALKDVIRMGGIPGLRSTTRRPDQTAGAYFWAYDGANLIGTPPRLYNQILRQIAWTRKPSFDPTGDKTNADFARLFALANVAMADAGILCWKEKYHFEFWRPLSGVRQEDGPLADPFWLSVGAPDTNTNNVHFKPPFPAYPSGHATFGAACFQIARLHYNFAPSEPDNIRFDFVSDELNGISRELRMPFNPSRALPITEQPGTVRTRVVRQFHSLWEAIFENAISRIWLGVHWRFDAFSAHDALVASSHPGAPYKVEADGTTAYKDPTGIRYTTKGPRSDRTGQFPVGGVPLGLAIANDIFYSKLKPTPASMQPPPPTPEAPLPAKPPPYDTEGNTIIQSGEP